MPQGYRQQAKYYRKIKFLLPGLNPHFPATNVGMMVGGQTRLPAPYNRLFSIAH
jgi:hypothetical protein